MSEHKTKHDAVAGLLDPDSQIMKTWANIQEKAGPMGAAALAKIEKLEHENTHDELTGKLNRRGLYAKLHELMHSPEYDPKKYKLAYIDLDGFKGVNDAQGHAAGDRVLVEVADRLKLRRQDDIVARIGGDEFVVVSKRREELDPELADEKFRDYISYAVVQGGINAGQPGIGASIGLSDMSAFPDPAAVIHEADMRMQANKQIRGAGR